MTKVVSPTEAAGALREGKVALVPTETVAPSVPKLRIPPMRMLSAPKLFNSDELSVRLPSGPPVPYIRSRPFCMMWLIS